MDDIKAKRGHEEEKTNEELVLLYQNGDREVLKKLLNRNRGIVFKVVNKFNINGTNSIDKEDLEQEGYLGLIIAANKYRFDIENPCKFITYAVYWIYQKVHRFVHQKNTNSEMSLNVPLNEDVDTTLIDTIKDEEDPFENVEEKIYIKQLHHELEEIMNKQNTLREREILKLRYGWDGLKPMTYQEIGEIFNVTGSMIMNNENTALGKIRRSSWGAKKAQELYREVFALSRYNIHRTEEKINFAEKYLRQKGDTS